VTTRAEILKALRATDGNVQAAGRKLGMSRQLLLRKMDILGMHGAQVPIREAAKRRFRLVD
jgi:transcriptional regulator of acetoin/glycerol metabolism